MIVIAAFQVMALVTWLIGLFIVAIIPASFCLEEQNKMASVSLERFMSIS